MNQNKLVDVVVVGGGATGISAAIALARSLRSVVVIDAGQPRNAPSNGAHNVFTRDGVAPAELLRIAREEAAGFGVQFVDGDVSTGVRAADRVFELRLAEHGIIRGRRVLIATGLTDELPPIPGVRELWGKDVLHCPYCHGWEVRGKRIGVIGKGPMSAHQALMFRQLSTSVTLFLNTMPEPNPEQWEQFAALGIEVVDGLVDRLLIEQGRLRGLALEGGSEFILDAVTVAPRFVANAHLYEALGGSVVEHPAGVGTHIPVDPTGRTPVEGVWAAGNVADLTAMVAASAGAGVTVATQINADLLLQDVQQAMTEHTKTVSGAGAGSTHTGAGAGTAGGIR